MHVPRNQIVTTLAATTDRAPRHHAGLITSLMENGIHTVGEVTNFVLGEGIRGIGNPVQIHLSQQARLRTRGPE